MKPALFYTLQTSYGFVTMIAVTSTASQMLCGRRTDGRATRVNKSECYGKFSSFEEAAQGRGFLLTMLGRHENALMEINQRHMIMMQTHREELEREFGRPA